MDRFLLPQGEGAALVPGVSYSIPGLFLYSELVYTCLDQVEAKFGYRIPVRYLYGSPQVRWNCGRLVLVDHGETLEAVERELTGARSRGITPLLTFSVPTLTREELEDARGNEILRLLNEVQGGAIVSDLGLRDHIRTNYPRVEVHGSVIRTSQAKDRDKAYYRELAREFDCYVVHPDDNFETDLLKGLPKEKAEILINERCVYQCAQRDEHYASTASDQALLLEGKGPLSNFLSRCPFVPDWKQRDVKERNISLSGEEVRDLANIGFRLFKLQGRLDIPYVFFFDFLRYTLENETAFPAMYPVFCFAIRNYLKEKEQRRGRGERK